jgi:hypothetical protein
MREQKKNLKRLQRSVRIFSDLAGTRPPREYGETYYSRMLVEDVANGLVPYGGRSDFTVSLEPASLEVESLLAEGLDRDGYGRHLSDSVRDLLREVAQTVLAFGDAPYEMIYYSDPGTDKLVTFGLSFILPWTLKRKGRGDWVQTIPKNYAERLKAPSQIQLPSDSVFRFRLPGSIDRYFARMMTDLDVLGRDMYPAFGIPTPGSAVNDIGFDFQEWHKCHDIAPAQATLECGWNARNSFPEEITEFYYVQRFLRFERFKLELRTSLVSQVNDLLQLVGNRLGFSGRMVIAAPPDTAQIDQSTQELESGAASFAEVMKPYMHY